MQANNADFSSLHAHYSPTAKASIGYRGEWWRDEDWHFQGLQYNALLKRWNAPASQANIYFKSALGVRTDDSGPSDERSAAGFVGFSTDWEDRRWFVSYGNRAFVSDQDNFFTQTARAGVAPYIGDYGDLHTWLMLQVEHKPEGEDSIKVTPLVRMFKGPFLIEAGANEDGEGLFNFIWRY